MNRGDISDKNFQEIDVTDFLDDQNQLREGQEKVDAYNATLEDKVPELEGKVFVHKNLVIKLEMEDYAIEATLDEEPTLVSNRQHIKVATGEMDPITNRPKHITVGNPVPYLPTGIVKSFDPELKKDYPWIKEGLRVDIMPFDVMGHMYYPDKKLIDLDPTDEDIRENRVEYRNFTGLVKIPVSMIESYEA